MKSPLDSPREIKLISNHRSLKMLRPSLGRRVTGISHSCKVSSCSEKSSQAKIKFVFLVKQLVSVGQWRLLSLDCARASVHSSPAAGDSSRRKHLSALIPALLPITATNDWHQQSGRFYYSEI